MVALQHSSMRKSLLRQLTIYHAFSQSYAVIPSFLVSVFFSDPYFIFKFMQCIKDSSNVAPIIGLVIRNKHNIDCSICVGIGSEP